MKKAYAKPVLVIHGTLASLTAAPSGEGCF